MKHILITGGAGFIGANLSKKLLDAGHRVTAIDNLITSNGENIKALSKNPNFKFIKHDITRPFSSIVNGQLSMVNKIYHLACPTGVSNLIKFSEEMLLACSIGTKNVLDLALKNRAKLIFTSSSEVYGNPEKFPQNENYSGNVNTVGIRSPYEEGKRFSESLMIMYVRKYKLNACIARVFNTYGPLMSLNDSRVIPKFLNQIYKNLPLTVEGKGKQTRTFCYINDLVNALTLLMEKGEKGEVYNAGSDIEISILELAKLVLFIIGSNNKIVFVKRPSHDHNRRIPDLAKINKLGWHDQAKLEEGLRKTIQWFGL